MRPALVLLFASLMSPGVLAVDAGAQEFADVQTMANRVLFAGRDAADRQHAIERQRVEALDQRTRQQSALLQQQAVSVRLLGSDLQMVRTERQLEDLAQSFDAALVAGQWQLARSLLTETVSVDIADRPDASAIASTADAFVSQLQASLAQGGILPRSNQRVRIGAESAVLMSDGYAWRRDERFRSAAPPHFGRYEYGFARTAGGWKIDALAFRSSPPQPAGSPRP